MITQPQQTYPVGQAKWAAFAELSGLKVDEATSNRAAFRQSRRLASANGAESNSPMTETSDVDAERCCSEQSLETKSIENR